MNTNLNLQSKVLYESNKHVGVVPLTTLQEQAVCLAGAGWVQITCLNGSLHCVDSHGPVGSPLAPSYGH